MLYVRLTGPPRQPDNRTFPTCDAKLSLPTMPASATFSSSLGATGICADWRGEQGGNRTAHQAQHSRDPQILPPVSNHLLTELIYHSADTRVRPMGAHTCTQAHARTHISPAHREHHLCRLTLDQEQNGGKTPQDRGRGGLLPSTFIGALVKRGCGSEAPTRAQPGRLEQGTGGQCPFSPL